MKVKRVLSKRYRSRTRSFSKERARDSKISFPLTAARRSREKGRERGLRDAQKPHPNALFSLFSLCKCTKKRSPTEWVVYTSVSCTFSREDLCEYVTRFLSLSLSPPFNGVCVFVWPEELLFFTSLSLPFFVFWPRRRQSSSSADLIKKIKKRERSLSFSLARSSTKKRFLQLVRDAFSLPSANFSSCRIVESKKSGKNPKPSRGTFSSNARTRARRKRERKKDVRFRTNRTFFFFAVRFVFVFRAREKERKKLCAEDWERERATVRYLYQLLTHTSKREIKK